jgi:hypothetical protein
MGAGAAKGVAKGEGKEREQRARAKSKGKEQGQRARAKSKGKEQGQRSKARANKSVITNIDKVTLFKVAAHL